jgi:nucleoside-diphosphate-sugar epimerase
VIPKFITAMLHNEAPIIYGDGLQSRDFTFVANVVHANLLACVREEAIGQVINVACCERYTLIELHRELKELIGTNVDMIFSDTRRGDIKHSMASIDVAREKLGYHPLVSWKEGLKKCVEWYKRDI